MDATGVQEITCSTLYTGEIESHPLMTEKKKKRYPKLDNRLSVRPNNKGLGMRRKHISQALYRSAATDSLAVRGLVQIFWLLALSPEFLPKANEPFLPASQGAKSLKAVLRSHGCWF